MAVCLKESVYFTAVALKCLETEILGEFSSCKNAKKSYFHENTVKRCLVPVVIITWPATQ